MPAGLRRGKVSCCCSGTISGCAQGLAPLSAALGSRTDCARGAFPPCSTSGPSGGGLWRAGGPSVPGWGSCMCPVLWLQERLPCDSFCHGSRNQTPCETFPAPPAVLLLFLQPSNLMSCEEKLQPCPLPHCPAGGVAATVSSGCLASRALELVMPLGRQRRKP